MSCMCSTEDPTGQKIPLPKTSRQARLSLKLASSCPSSSRGLLHLWPMWFLVSLSFFLHFLLWSLEWLLLPVLARALHPCPGLTLHMPTSTYHSSQPTLQDQGVPTSP